MKKISYQYCVKVNYGTEENPEYVNTFLGKTLICHTDEEYEKSLLVAQQEAYNGEYTVEEIPEEVSEPTWQDKIEAQVTYNSMMLGTLIEEV